MSKEMHKFIKPVGTRSGTMYGLCKVHDTGEGLTKSEPKQLLCLATKKSYFIFNGLLYKQTDGVAMGSPLGPSLANVFLSYHEKNWLNSSPQGFKPVFYRLQIE